MASSVRCTTYILLLTIDFACCSVKMCASPVQIVVAALIFIWAKIDCTATTVLNFHIGSGPDS